MTGTVPGAPNFLAGYAPVPADFNGWVQAPFTFLTTKVVFRATLTTGITVTKNAYTQLPFNNIIEDPYSGWNSGTNSWQCPLGCSGWYEVTVTGWIVPMSGAAVQPVAGLNGSAAWSLDSSWTDAGLNDGGSGAVLQSLIGGLDSIYGYLYLTASANGTTATTAGQQCAIEIVWVSM